MRGVAWVVGCAWGVACGGEPAPIEADGQLEAASARSTDGDGAERDQAVTGSATVTGEGRDWTLTLDDGSALALHLPGESSPAALDGATLTLEPWVGGPEAAAEDQGALVSDARGPVLVVGSGAAAFELTDRVFGPGAAAYGAVSSTASEGGFLYAFRSVTFAADDGPVEVSPGEVAELTVDGRTWRLVVHGAYTVGTDPDWDGDLPGCGGPTDWFGFEAELVDGPVGLGAALVRRGGFPGAFGCAGPPSF